MTQNPAPSPTAADKPDDAAPPTAAKAPPVRIVIPGEGLQSRTADEARRLIDAGSARPATPRDLAIAGLED